jgi:hypothetical protein
MELRKFVVAASICDSNYSCFVYGFIWEFPAEYECVTHLCIPGSENGVQ